MITMLVVIVGLIVCIFIFLNTKQFGSLPTGERLELKKNLQITGMASFKIFMKPNIPMIGEKVYLFQPKVFLH